jgi:hypothetical protein
MCSLVPEYLRKGELIFEVRSRGEVPGADVRTLRSQLRAVQSVVPCWQTEFVLEDELKACKDRVEELSGEIEGWTVLPTGTARLSSLTQLLHWQSRLKLVCTASGIGESDKSWAEERIVEFQGILEKLQARSSVEEMVQKFELGTSASITKGGAGDGVPAGGSTAELSGTNATSVDTENVLRLPVLSIPEAVSTGVGGVPSVVHSVPASQTVGEFPTFARLPHPLASTLSGLRPVNGLEVDALLTFLERVLRIREFPGMSDAVLLKLLAPYCLKPLSDRLLDCLRRGVDFDAFHAEVLDYFVPVRVMERLKVERVFRAQLPREALSQYVGDVRMLARVLRLGIPEHQLVDMVLQGLKPEERSRLVFAPRPSSFAELEKLVILSRSVQDADVQRSQAIGHSSRGHSNPVVAHIRQDSVAPQVQRRPIVCFGCGQPGHIRRDCRRGQPNGSGPKNL